MHTVYMYMLHSPTISVFTFDTYTAFCTRAPARDIRIQIGDLSRCELIPPVALSHTHATSVSVHARCADVVDLIFLRHENDDVDDNIHNIIVDRTYNKHDECVAS